MRILFLLLLVSCGSLRTKDFNQIDMGMSQKQVIKLLGEPETTKGLNGAKILEYTAKDASGEDKTRWVALKDQEVVFYGKPSEYKEAEAKASQNGDNKAQTNTVTVSPVISPIFNISGQSPQGSNPTIPLAPKESNTSFYPAP